MSDMAIRGAWHKHHDTQIVYNYDDELGERSATIKGSGTDWRWTATVWRGGFWAEQKGEAVSAESAKEDVLRWFLERERK